MRLASLPFAAVLLIAAPAAAQQADEANGDFAIIGAGAGLVPDYEGSADYRLTPVPGAIGSIGGISFQLAGNRLSLDLIADAGGSGWDIQAGPIGVVNFNRSSSSAIDNAQVAALPERDAAIELGGFAGIARVGVLTSDYDRLSLTFAYRHDISGVHDSGIWTPTLSYMTPLSRKAMVSTFVSADHVGDGYADAYFDISPADSLASGLAVYDADGGWKNWGTGIGGAYAITGDLRGGLLLVAGLGYRRLLGDFADSPVTRAGDRDQWMGIAGFAWSF
jgi:MipA family protein